MTGAVEQTRPAGHLPRKGSLCVIQQQQQWAVAFLWLAVYCSTEEKRSPCGREPQRAETSGFGHQRNRRGGASSFFTNDDVHVRIGDGHAHHSNCKHGVRCYQFRSPTTSATGSSTAENSADSPSISAATHTSSTGSHIAANSTINSFEEGSTGDGLFDVAGKPGRVLAGRVHTAEQPTATTAKSSQASQFSFEASPETAAWSPASPTGSDVGPSNHPLNWHQTPLYSTPASTFTTTSGAGQAT